jgi:hypothetical protein
MRHLPVNLWKSERRTPMAASMAWGVLFLLLATFRILEKKVCTRLADLDAKASYSLIS